MGRFLFPSLIAAIMALGTTACTRKVDDDKVSLNLSFPTSSGTRNKVYESVGAQSQGDIMVLIINVQIPGYAPISRELDFHNGGAPGTSYNMQVEVPRISGLLVQALGVYEGAGSSYVFKYGEAPIDASQGSEVTANLTVNTISASTGENFIAGRVLTGTNPDVGPSGTVDYYYTPPGRPPMKIMSSDFVNGWFNLFALEGAGNGFRYIARETGQEIFDSIYTVGDSLFIDGQHINMNVPHRMFVKKPAAYRKGQYGSVESAPEAKYYLGYFEASGTTITNKTIYTSNLDQSMPRLFKDTSLSDPVIWKTGSSLATDVLTRRQGGELRPFNIVYNSLSFTAGASDSLMIFHPHLVDYGGHNSAEYLGFKAPFLYDNAYNSNPSSINMSYNTLNNSLQLSWKLIGGAATPGVVNGVKLFSKYSMGGWSSGGSSSTPCNEEAQSAGFVEVDDIPSSVSGSTLSAASLLTLTGGTLNSSSYYGFQIRACAYKDTALYGRTYYQTAHAHGVNNSGGESYGFGWGATTLTLNAVATSLDDDTNFKTTSGKISTINTASPYYTEITSNMPIGYASGELTGGEVMLTLTGKGSSASCGNTQVSQPVFVRVLDHYGTYSLRIEKGTFVDRLDTNEVSNPANSGTNFCRVHITPVKHFKDLTLNNSIIKTESHNHDGRGGLMAIRVSGVLTLNGSTLSAEGKGFGGATLDEYYGIGTGGLSGTSMTMNGGGKAIATGGGGGGAGFGNGGNGSGSSSGGTGMNSNYGSVNPIIGGGGGGGFVNYGGGDGGGAIFVSARKIVVTNASVMNSNGKNATAAMESGGGGGGSVNLISESISGTSTLSILSDGGSGTSTYGGGGGGGGLSSVGACEISGVTVTTSAAGGAHGGGAGATAGTTGTAETKTSATHPNDVHWCNY